MSACAVDPVIRELCPDALSLGDATWSVPLQNGRRHHTRVAVDRDGLVVIATSLQGEERSPSQLAAINPLLPPGCRMVCAPEGVRLLAELAPTDTIPVPLERALQLFQTALDLFCSAPEGFQPNSAAEDPGFVVTPEATSEWQLTNGPDGTSLAKLPHRQGSLTASVSASGVVVPISAPAGCADDVREALSELLLRTSSKVRFVRSCVKAHSDGKWSAWTEVPAGVCELDDALTALALICRDCGAEAIALTDPGLAAIYRDFCSNFQPSRASSVWQPSRRPTLEERR